tara:strand:+ start:585 stop:812 length:228 start_codon:yes stop_codon:yes gene_type:complete
MEVTKELITWYVNEKAKIILEYNPYEAFNIISNHFAESLSGGNYSDKEIFEKIEEDCLIPLDDVKQYGYDKLGEN